MVPTVVDQFLTEVVNKPDIFFSTNQTVVDNALKVAKYFYDTSKKTEVTLLSPFTELLIEGFDHDQIWEEIASQNEPFLDYAKQTLYQFKHQDQFEESDASMVSEQSEDEGSEEELSEDIEMEEMSAEEMSAEEELKSADEEMDSSEEEEEEEKVVPKTSEVDDDFFNLDEFNQWTEKQEELDMLSDKEDDGFDLDKDYLNENEEDSEEEEEDEDDGIADAAELSYNDFFEKPDHKLPYTPKKKVHFEEDELEEDELEDESEEEEEKVKNLFEDESEEEEEDKSSFQRQQEKLSKQIEQFEEENINTKHWTLRGEASAKVRPVNSLLEEDLEFEHANKPVPVITQETTDTLEEMIKKRIVDNMFDDVERKVDPTLKPFVPSKRVDISDEKSKKSLADLYEEEYVKKSTNDKSNEKDDALEKEHDEIKSLFSTLCYKLDALSNFHFTPKEVRPEMNIVSNVSSISMEEVIPVNVSDATLLAPEEVYEKKKTDVKSTSEMDSAERKKLRAQKKKMKRKEKSMKERELKIVQKYNPKAGQKQAKVKAVKELLGQKNVTLIK
ncbi:U3 small nucleolar ribonucleoprotein complex, subunit Mpp10 [Pilobolus umbonatus]|nr:U3 small nucleolar ribonucleoprotein complex, subunit Mpp10 [Pilobolus umbonatus]